MKRLNDSPEMLIVAAGLLFTAVFMLFSVFYKPPITVEKIIYSPSARQSETADRAETYSSAALETEKINLNTASKEQLITLTGIGEAKALRIIDYRTSNGSFQTIDELKNVEGIGEKTFEAIKQNIIV